MHDAPRALTLKVTFGVPAGRGPATISPTPCRSRCRVARSLKRVPTPRRGGSRPMPPDANARAARDQPRKPKPRSRTTAGSRPSRSSTVTCTGSPRTRAAQLVGREGSPRTPDAVDRADTRAAGGAPIDLEHFGCRPHAPRQPCPGRPIRRTSARRQGWFLRRDAVDADRLTGRTPETAARSSMAPALLFYTRLPSCSRAGGDGRSCRSTGRRPRDCCNAQPVRPSDP